MMNNHKTKPTFGAPVKNWIERFVIRVRFGEIKAIQRGTIAGVVCEIEYQGRGGEVVGYWAYGSFDPGYPYKG